MSQLEPPRLPQDWRRRITVPRGVSILGGAAVLGLSVLGLDTVRTLLPDTAQLLLLLAAVLLNAVAFGFWVGLASALGALFLFNFFFVDPRHTLLVSRPEDLVMLGVFLLVAGLTGLLAGRLREQVDAAEGRAAVLEILSQVSSDLAAAETPVAVLSASARHLGAVALGPAMVLAPRGTGLQLLASHPPGTLPDSLDLMAADQALRRRRVEFAAEAGWNGSRYTFHPLATEDGLRPVLGHRYIDPRRRDLAYREQAISVILRQTELALQRLAFADRAEAERLKAEAEALRAALLASLSHDLRTPLATILGSVTTLRELGGTLPETAQSDLLAAIEEEAGRLSRYVEKLLQMTRLQAGLSVRLAWIDAADVAASAVERARRAFPQSRIDTRLPHLPMIRAEAGMLEQALFNLLENAVKYGAAPIRLEAALAGDEVQLSVTDGGSGLPAGVIDWLATPFAPGDPAAAGLGLPICKGIAQALGGRLGARSPVRDGRGTAIWLSLPIPPEAQT